MLFRASAVEACGRIITDNYNCEVTENA